MDLWSFNLEMPAYAIHLFQNSRVSFQVDLQFNQFDHLIQLFERNLLISNCIRMEGMKLLSKKSLTSLLFYSALKGSKKNMLNLATSILLYFGITNICINI